MRVPVSVSVNGQVIKQDVEPRLLLVHFLREIAGLTGTKVGCDTSQCGSCTVLVDGAAVKSALETAAKSGVWRDSAPRDPVFSSTVMPDEKIAGAVTEVYSKFKYVVDPHTACAFATPAPAGGAITLVALALEAYPAAV